MLIVASGNIVHNLRALDWTRPSAGFDWAHRFDDAARELLTSAPAETPRLARHPDHEHAAPTPDHLVPMLYLAGLAAAAGAPPDVLVDGYAYGSLSMTSYTLGAPHPPTVTPVTPAAPLPPGDVVPPESTNT